MAGEKGSEPSSQPLVAEPVADVSKVTAQMARERMTEMRRLVREAAKTPRAPKRTVGENHDPAPACSSEAIASAPAENAKRVAEETSGSTGICNQLAGPREAMAEIGKTASAESHSASRLPSREAITDEARPQALAQTSPERPAPWEIERQLELAGLLQPTAAQTLARWRDALWEALHGRWSEAGWEFARGVFHLLTQGARWRGVGKAVLHFLARFIPGREPEVLRRSREIKELFRDLHEEPKEPGAWSNCAK